MKKTVLEYTSESARTSEEAAGSAVTSDEAAALDAVVSDEAERSRLRTTVYQAVSYTHLRNRPRPHLGGEAAVALFVERHTGRRVQCCRQMDHKKPLLFGQCAKLNRCV